MLIVDRALEQRLESTGPVRVALVGSGFVGRGVVHQIVNHVPTMDVPVVANRTLATAVAAYRDAGVADDDIVIADDVATIEAAVAAGRHVATDNALAVAAVGQVEAVVDATGAVPFGAELAAAAIDHGKHVVLMNAELDGTVGAALKARADRAGVVVTACDGDQPGTQLNLHRFLVGIGARPLVCGNIKGLLDRYRTPETQRGFAEEWGQDPYKVTTYADGTKISFEQAIVANATGMTVARRGMAGHRWDGHIDGATSLYDIDELEALGGVVDYVVGAQPGPGIFVFAALDHPSQHRYLQLYKLGDGPLYSFYTPFHLCHFEVPMGVARAVLFHDAVVAAAGPPRVEVIARAKTDLAAGTTLDGLGGFHLYGECETAAISRSERLLPIGMSEGCVLRRDVAKDACVGLDEVDRPTGRVLDALRSEQDRMADD